MRRAFSALVAGALLLTAGAAAEEAGDRRMLSAAEAGAFRAVGRLNVAGTRFCTATLIAPQRIVTAAHCLYHPRTLRAVPLSEFRFVAGLRRGAHAPVRRVARAAVLPGFGYDGAPRYRDVREDLALLELDAAVAPEAAAPFPVGALGDGELAIVSYARDRPFAASIQRPCRLRGPVGGVAAVSCEATFGVSGAPVLAETDDGWRVVAVVSAIGEDAAGDRVAVAVMLAPRLAELEAAFSAP